VGWAPPYRGVIEGHRDSPDMPLFSLLLVPVYNGKAEILEDAMDLVGIADLCFMLHAHLDLVFEAGSTLVGQVGPLAIDAQSQQLMTGLELVPAIVDPVVFRTGRRQTLGLHRSQLFAQVLEARAGELQLPFLRRCVSLLGRFPTHRSSPFRLTDPTSEQ
jgi:hypothetical protein